ncbi:endonuclease/exonuclease/phosphatase family metal-dependent hydrolase [Ereboglobus sp. PH5-10]|uniref:endonuclease/exonuclease/phosphatase family protein n=1 Tax=Ereboglobus sp. PH5-10 TaxID=2940629 RepID=UPI0024062F6F|nr:endonuclease/exonuclease/phosphatase family protein [Ereboglobus sp. PH5-10]MDF9826977.1 endonuclease/exonuclease/phosphatase family metal-dependent hydrolase [Ereboglobus sp. PH5-10]
MHRRQFIPSLAKTALIAVLAMLALSLPAQTNDIPARKRQNADAVRVVTANIRHTYFLADKKTGNDWDSRKELCRDVILAQDADIICLQENHIGQVSYLRDHLPNTEFHNFFEMKDAARSTKKDLYVPILYSTKRFEKLDGGGFWLSDTPETAFSKYEDAYMARSANWLVLKDKNTGKKLCVLNTHLEHKFSTARVKQIAVLLKFAGALPKDLPVVITGDFNADADSPSLQLARKEGWLDSHTAIHGPADPGGTAHRFLGAEFLSTPQGKTRKKIDFILHNKLLAPIDAEIIKDARKGKYPSDHYFVSAEFEHIR